jgi:hypothetical protein
MKILVSFLLFLIASSCGNYTFSGKSIPPNVKNAQLALFEDNSGRYDLSLPELLNEKLIQYITDYNYFELENSSDADAKINGTVMSYAEKVSSQTRDEIVDQMEMTLSVEVNFFNNGLSEYVVKNLRISDTEYYESSGGDEARSEAFEKLLDKVSDKIVLGLSSNW